MENERGIIPYTYSQYVKYKERECALGIFLLSFPHGVINNFMSLRNFKSNKYIYCKDDAVKL